MDYKRQFGVDFVDKFYILYPVGLLKILHFSMGYCIMSLLAWRDCFAMLCLKLDVVSYVVNNF